MNLVNSSEEVREQTVFLWCVCLQTWYTDDRGI